MPIPVECEACYSPFEIPSKYAGKKVRCKVCGEPIRVPRRSRSRSSESDPFKVEESISTESTHSLPPRSRSLPASGQRKKSRSSRKKRSQPENSLTKLILGVVGLFLVLFPVALLFPQVAKVFVPVAAIVGCGFYLWGHFSLLIVAGKDGTASGLFCFFLTPIYVIYTAFTDWEKISRPVHRLFASIVLYMSSLFVLFATMDPQQKAVAQREQGERTQRQLQEPAKRRLVQPKTVPASEPIDDHSPYPIKSITPPLPAFPGSFSQSDFDGVERYSMKIRKRSSGKIMPGDMMQYRVYLPEGDHADRSLPCVLVPPAGSPLMTGMVMDDLQSPEHIPYVRAGYAVITFTLDGWAGDLEKSKDAQIAYAYQQFKDAFAGLVNAHAAFRFAKRKVSVIDPDRIFIAGHSSAGTLALLYAAHEPELAGCIAYCASTDVEGQLAPVVEKLDETNLFPGLKEFSRRSSPKTHASRIQCPLFVYHATGDTVTPFSAAKAYCEDLKRQGKDITFVEGNGSDHYQTMISEGIPAALDWLSERAKPSSHSEASPLAVVRPDDRSVTSSLDDQQASDEAAFPPSSKSQIASGNADPSGNGPGPAGTVPVQPDTELKPGMRVIAHHGATRWEGAEIVNVEPSGEIKVHYLRLPAAFDKLLPRFKVRLQLPADQIDDDLLRTAEFKVLQYFGDEAPDGDAIEKEYLMMEGYIPGSLKVVLKSRTVSVQVIRGSDADQNAIFPLVKSKMAVQPIEKPARNRSRRN